MDRLLLKPEEAADILGVGRSRVYDQMRAHVAEREDWALSACTGGIAA